MKKTLFMLAAASLAMTACTNTEEVEQGFAQTSKQIGFVSHVNKNTRVLGNDNFNQFSVFGSYTTKTNLVEPVQIFNGVQVSKTGSKWSYSDQYARYWIKDANYTFYAYSKENRTTGTSRFAGSELTLEDYTVNEENQQDLVFASATGITGADSGNSPVAFDFKHILSKIHFNFISKFPAGYKVKVDNVRIKNMRDKGVFTASTNAWSTQRRSVETEDDKTMLTINAPIAADKSNIIEQNGEVATNEIYVLPYTYTSPNVRIYFELTIINQNNEEVSKSENFGAFKPTWIQGTAYKYNVTLTGAEAGLEKIEFTTAENMNLGDWASGSDTNLSFGANINNPTPEE